MTSADITQDRLRELAQHAKAWPFEEARKLLKRMDGRPENQPVVFETGYGPSGLPHLGTFGEVARTSMVRHAFSLLSDRPTRLICFSDDMDGLRKVPDNLPNAAALKEHIDQPLSRIPDPFGTHESFAAHNNAMLRGFLDRFGFDYEFYSSTECYASGRFDDALLRVLRAYDKVMAAILPTLGPERRATYSPFLPISPVTGKVLQVPMLERDEEAGTITFAEPTTGEAVTVPVTGGHCKLQWKPDWGMRWAALGVDYEMYGKDLIDSVRLSAQICRAIGGRPPEGFNYELFLDEEGGKISKSKGNGLTIEEWLRYGPPESLSLFMYQSPRKAKRLHLDVIPKHVDEYYAHAASYHSGDPEKRLNNPAFHIHAGPPPDTRLPVDYAMLLNLVSASNASDARVLWGFIEVYAPGTTAEAYPELDRLVHHAIRYFEDFVRPRKRFRQPDERDRAALTDLATRLRALPKDADGETIQDEVYAVGNGMGYQPLRAWFETLYEVLLGQTQGPRFGSFVAIFGIDRTLALIEAALAGTLTGESL